jgi:hypothetical protein
MYHCPECNKEIKNCPGCKQPVRDGTASILYQISGACIFVALIFFVLEIKIKEEIETAMKPFRIAEEIAAKKNKVKATDLPKPPKKEKAEAEKKKPEEKDGEKKSDVQGKTADFRAGVWGASRKKIEEDEKAEKLDRANPYSLDYLARVGNYDAITRYEFSSNRLQGGNYVVFGQKVKDLDQLRSKTLIKAGEPCSSAIANEFAIYRMPRNQALSELNNIDQFFYEMYISLASQHGMPTPAPLPILKRD